MMIFLAWILLVACCLGIALVCGGYPLLIGLWGRLHTSAETSTQSSEDEDLPTVTVIVVARNAEKLIAGKLDNCLSLDYPADKLDVIACSDGSTDTTAAIMESYRERGVRPHLSNEHLGKIDALNTAAQSATTELLVFTDADALLAPDAVRKLARHFTDPQVGGVCGQRMIANDAAQMSEAQQKYINLDSGVKVLESRMGRLSANDGKLYAVRRTLYQPIPRGVTDDLFVCLSIIHQGYRFLFEPKAFAAIKVPSRSIKHELGRRRRIVTQSLRGIYLHRGLLNPFKYGLFSIGLLINKVMRRMLLVFLLGIFAATVALASRYRPFCYFATLQLLGYLLAVAAVLLNASGLHIPIRKLHKSFELVSYITVGNIGTLSGVLSFLSGQRVEKWDPVKGKHASEAEVQSE